MEGSGRACFFGGRANEGGEDGVGEAGTATGAEASASTEAESETEREKSSEREAARGRATGGGGPGAGLEGGTIVALACKTASSTR